MATEMDEGRRKLVEQVLEYWYTTDFLAQGALKTEETKRDRDNYIRVMGAPERFNTLFRRGKLKNKENILDEIRRQQDKIDQKRIERFQNKQIDREGTNCVHGNISVTVGRSNRAVLTARLAELLHCDPPLNPSADQIAWGAFMLTPEGKYIQGSFSVSPVLWAVGRISAAEPEDSMYDVLNPEDYKAACKAYDRENGTPMAGAEAIGAIAGKIFEDMVKPIGADTEEAESVPEINFSYSIYRTEEERNKRETEDSYGLSMSFYAEDLGTFRSVFKKGSWPADNKMWSFLLDYICAPYDMEHGQERERTDLSLYALQDPGKAAETKERFREILAPSMSPWGKWPSRYRPFLMQQVAINLAINSDDPIFAVNGPPGTGKTALLREIIVDSVVKKAMYLCRFERADQAFVTQEYKAGIRTFSYYALTDRAKGAVRYGIVVASSNNAAVENITRQLPLASTIEENLTDPGKPGLEEIRRLFSIDEAGTETVYRRDFSTNETRPVELPEIYFSDYVKELLYDRAWGLISAPLGRRGNVVNFHKRVLDRIKWDHYKGGSSVNQARQLRYQQARKDLCDQYSTVKAIREQLERIAEQALRTGAEYAGEGEDCFSCITDQLFKDLNAGEIETRKRAQQANPNTSDRYDREREKLFYRALVFLREFILTSDCCRSNLNLLASSWGVEKERNDLLAGMDAADREGLLKASMAALMQTLQIMVPVISTTFASAGRFFKYVNRFDALGTVIVDEAGQATPQAALRLFSKAARAIVVGDPNQIDPVVTDDLAFLQSRLDQEIGKVYSDKTISVQKIADYLSRYGGMQKDAFHSDVRKWVGVPLYVHSRCIEPMFSISNRLSYGEAMIRITGEPKMEIVDSFCYRMTQWINVGGNEEKEKNHFVRKQGERAMELLEEAFRKSQLSDDEKRRESGPDLFIISPFHTVAEEMRQMISNASQKEYPFLAANRMLVEDWLTDEDNPHVGTVHTFQGREANEVIFLLGCDMQSKRSANWVSRNIVNVAVSRAKYRLYVIGDGKVWTGCEPIVQMKRDLDIYGFESLAAAAGKELQNAENEEFCIPEIPSCEIFDIESTDGDPDEEPIIRSENVVRSIQQISEFGSPLTEEELGLFGLENMEQFNGSFSPEVREQLWTGFHMYLLMKPAAEKLNIELDASCVGICFCKALEMHLREVYLRGMKILAPDTLISGKTLLDMDDSRTTIGVYAAVSGQRADDLGHMMKELGRAEYDRAWWEAFHIKTRICQKNRNECCHVGKLFTWDQLEILIQMMFEDTPYEDKATGMKRVIHGLVFDTGFREAVDAAYDESYIPEAVSRRQAEENAGQLPDPKGISFVKECFLVNTGLSSCPEDNTALLYEVKPVMKKNGTVRKLNMLYCEHCGRCYISLKSLGNTVHLEDFELECKEL